MMKKLAAKSKSIKKGLTKSQLLRQPQRKYMSEEQLEFFKALLAQEHKNARSTLGDLQNQSKSEHEKLHSADFNDVAAMNAEIAVTEKMIQREQNLLRKIEVAMLAIEKGEYGYCRETGKPIGIKRLLLSPTAIYSVEAKARQEQKKNHPR